jgi:S1-C subfamily serine protease
MLRALALAVLVFVPSQGSPVQDGRSVLQIKIALMDGERKLVPVPRYVLLVSDNPPTAPPRRIRTAPDGTTSVPLRQGSYTVESEQPVTFQGKSYQWTQIVEIAAGRDTVLDLTAENAEVTALTAAADPSTTSVSAPSLEADPSSLLIRWQDSVVAVWSPTASASGFVADARGLIVTSQRAIGSATSVEVQLAPTIKVAASVLVADPVRDVGVVWIDPRTAASVAAVPLGCLQAGKSQVASGQEIVAIGVRFPGARTAVSGSVSEVEGRVILADLRVAAGGAGGPVFAAGGNLIGITALGAQSGDRGRRDSEVVRIEEVCAAVSAAELRMKDAAAPDGARLPVEPERPFPYGVLKERGLGTGVSPDSYRVSSSSYDVTFLTPVLLYARQKQTDQARARDRAGVAGNADPRSIDPLDDFSNWAPYVADLPPVLMIRVTPKLAEGFWTRIARGAAQTQGVSLPPIKRFKPGFARLQAFCGDAQMTPIHPFRLEQRISESEAIYEGLYVFDPGALGPPCGTVRLVLYSETESQKGDTRAVDPKVLQQVWDDFAPYREQK